MTEIVIRKEAVQAIKYSRLRDVLLGWLVNSILTYHPQTDRLVFLNKWNRLPTTEIDRQTGICLIKETLHHKQKQKKLSPRAMEVIDQLIRDSNMLKVSER